MLRALLVFLLSDACAASDACNSKVYVREQQYEGDVQSALQMNRLSRKRDADARRSNGATNDNLSPTDLNGIVNPAPEIGSRVISSIGLMVDQVMGRLQPILEHELDQHAEAFGSNKQGLIDIDVSPTFDISVHTDMADAFHDNNGAHSHTGMVTRTNGVQLNADFSNSLHNNNNAIGNSNVTRANGVVVDETSASMLHGAVKGIGNIAEVTQRISPRKRAITSAVKSLQNVGNALGPMAHEESPARDSSAEASRTSSSSVAGPERDVPSEAGAGFIRISVRPAFKIDMTTNMSGAFYDNNDAFSDAGDVQRVNGVNLIANFSNALHDNNGAISKQGSVQMLNGLAAVSGLDE